VPLEISVDTEGGCASRSRVVAEQAQALAGPLAQHLARRTGLVVVVEVLRRVTAGGTATTLRRLQVGDLALAQPVLRLEVGLTARGVVARLERLPKPDAVPLLRVQSSWATA
jgi:hypothetical protein